MRLNTLNHRRTVVFSVLVLLLVIANHPVAGASSSGQRFLNRRQSSVETEKEATTPSSKPGQQNSNNDGQSQADRLYPDLTRGPVFLPPFNAPPNQQQNGHMPPFIPYNTPFNVVNGQRLNADQQPGPFGPRILQQPRPMNPAERAQSNAFVDGLGKRLLSLVGISMNSNASDTNQSGMQSRSDVGAAHSGPFQNATILNELSKRMGMLMSGLSKMYNSTVQDQLNLLNEHFREMTKNGSTNSWQQVMAERVPAFFNQMAIRVSSTQEQLNRAWRDLIQAAQNKGSAQMTQSQPLSNMVNPNLNERLDGSPPPTTFFGNQMDPNNFFNQIGRSLGLNNQQQQQSELPTRLAEIWNHHVQPQIGMVRSQMAKIWRDLTASGAMNSNSLMNLRPVGAGNSSSSDLVDNLLKTADSESSEFVLATGDRSQGQPPPPSNYSGPVLNQQMFNRLMNVQRDLNRVWLGLSQSLQNAVNNARVMLNPKSRNASPSGGDPSSEPISKNEISDKAQELTKVQREADVLYDAIQKEQRESQQRQTLADRFRGFMNSVDLRNLNNLPDQIGAQVDRFGRVIGNFWETIPERWENLMARRQNQANQAKMEAEILNLRTSTTKPVSTTLDGQNP